VKAHNTREANVAYDGESGSATGEELIAFRERFGFGPGLLESTPATLTGESFGRGIVTRSTGFFLVGHCTVETAGL